MELYTSLTRLKMAMNDGRMPPMTPLTDRAREYLDPAFTPGMGALEESETEGLRCPVKACGKFSHSLGVHLSSSHRDIGGRSGVLGLLSIPDTVGLISAQRREKLSALMTARWASGTYKAHIPSNEDRRRGTPTRRATMRSVGMWNLMDKCASQVASRLLDLEHELGREPTFSEAEERFGRTFIRAAQRVFGSWSNLRAHVGMRVRRSGLTADEAYDSLKAWWEVNGHLPLYDEAAAGIRTPMIPEPRAILKAFKLTSWPTAMQQAAFVLGLDDHRYGANGVRMRPGGRGEEGPNSKLKEAQVREVLATIGIDGVTSKTLALKFGVTRSCIISIVQRKTWRHLKSA